MNDILTHQENGILTLTFNRLDKKNAITFAMYTALAEALERASTNAAVRVVVIQGHESIFTAGNDLMDFMQNADKVATASATGERPPVIRFLYALHDCPKPVIAAVAGPAVGIGTTLLLHCDFVYAGDNAAFSMPFTNLGLCAEGGSSDLFVRACGHRKAAEKLMLAEPFMADEALDMGLINRVLPAHELHAYAQAQANKLCKKPQASLMATKALMRRADGPLRDIMEAEFVEFGKLLAGPACREAIGAFMQKRVPNFEGM